MNKPVVSVCMTSYNQGPFIAQAIEGILMQEGDFTLELIIADDASTDGTAEICKEYARKYPQRIVFLRNEKNIGSMRNFIQVIKKCRGEYMAFCDGDDYWTDPLKLQKQISFLQENKEYGICFHKGKLLFSDGRLVDDYLSRVPAEVTSIDDLIRMNNYILTASVVLRNNFVLPQWFSNCTIGDYPLYLLAARQGKIKRLNETMSVYRVGIGLFDSLSEVKKRLSLSITFHELIKNYPDEKIKGKLIQRQRKDFCVFLFRFLFFREGGMNDLRFMASHLK